MIFANGQVIEEKEVISLSGRIISEFEGKSSIVRYISLSHNQLTSFSVKRGDFPNLELLDLRCNQLVSFSVERGSFPKLKKLGLYGNRITSFSTEEDWENLEVLSLSNNQLVSFSFGDAFPNLKFLYLHSNPDLEDLNISSPGLEGLWIKNTKIHFVDRSLIGKVRDGTVVKPYKHSPGTKLLITQAFHKDSPITDEIVEHLTR